MSDLLLNETAAPSTPASAKVKVYVDSADRALKTLDSKGVITSLANGSEPNLLRNSGLWFAQRQAPGTATTYSSVAGRVFCADGWAITNENASATYQRTDTSGSAETGLQGRYYGNFLKITSTGKLVVSQCIEGTDTNALRGRTVRFQCWLKQLVGTTPTVRIGVAYLSNSGTIDTIPATFISAFGGAGTDPTLGTNLALITPKAGVSADGGTVNGNAVDCILASSWQRFGVVVDIPATAKNIVVMVWGNAQFAATNGFAMSQASLTDGYGIQAWAPLPIPLELVRVRRYYQKTFDVDTAPAQNAGAATGAVQGIIGKAAAVALAAVIPWVYPVPMRLAAVTITQFSPESAAAAPWRTTGAAPAVQTAPATANSTTQGILVTATGDAAGVVGDRVHVHLTCDAEL